MPTPDVEMDGALEQMSSFADVSTRTTADEELYSSSMTGQHGAHFSPKAQEKAPTSAQVIPSCPKSQVLIGSALSCHQSDAFNTTQHEYALQLA